MASILSHATPYGSESTRVGKLESLCSLPELSKSMRSPLPDSRFEEISKSIEAEVQNHEWTNRPRTYFILWNIKRVETMEQFIARGLNDTSFPYSGRASLPDTLTYHQASDFLKWQELVLSDVLRVEDGTSHVRLQDGDALFEKRPTRLGVGSQGTTVVDKVYSKLTGKVYARKRINKRTTFGHDRNALKIYENEIDALKKVADHQHLIKVQGTYTDKKYLVMLLEPVADENLKQYLSRGGPRSPQEHTRFRTYFGCLAHTMRFLHDSDIEILHKDIKPENILIKDGELILTDFGTAFDWSKTGQSMTRSNASDVRTPRYQSPEVAHAGEFHRSSDMWSLGVVFLEMVTILRGKSLAQMDEYLVTHGHRVTAIHENIEGAMNWFQPLQASNPEFGSAVDNEPLSWIKEMLNRVQANRLTAAELYEKTAAFKNGAFCGHCCAENDFDSDDDLESEIETVLEDGEVEYGGAHSDRHRSQEFNGFDYQVKQGSVPGSFPTEVAETVRENSHLVDEAIVLTAKDDPVPGSFPTEVAETVRENSHLVDEAVVLTAKNEKPFHRSSDDDRTISLEPYISRRGKRGSSSSVFIRSSSSRAAPTRPKQDTFTGLEIFRSWLASAPAIPRRPTHLRARSGKESGAHTVRGPSVEDQRIQHFLSSLPEESADFDEMPEDIPNHRRSSQPFKAPRRSSTMPTSPYESLKRSISQENLQSTSHLLHEEADDDQFSGIPKSKLVHYASENDLNLALELTKEDLQEATKELKTFKTTISGFIDKARATVSHVLRSDAKQQSAQSLVTAEVVPKVPIDAAEQASGPATSWAGQILQNSLRESRGQPVLPSTIFPELSALPEVSALPHSSPALPPVSALGSSSIANSLSNLSPAANFATAVVQYTNIPPMPSTTGTKTSKTPAVGQTQPLETFMRAARRRQWESATIIMKRILDDKASVAPTSEMSASTRAIVAKGRFVMRWNDKTYGYLPWFIAQGKVGGVREMLKAGCNPGTEQKPRWSPVFNAIRGKTDSHTKCLRDLVLYGANVNAIKSSNGRTFLHYAVELEPWSGYSTVIYILLAAGVNPDIRDNANDLPLLMLLLGNGPLPQEKRDALYLLLGPNFKTTLEVSIPGTLDNPLHLAIRRKDAYTVDAILEKMLQVGGSALDLMHLQNGSGFTPLLLAFTIFTLAEDSAEEELQIIKLLLEKGANPDDQDVTNGETPLHLVVNVSKNSIALELLCKHSANPRTKNQAGKRPIDIARQGRLDRPQDTWYHFAERRMSNSLCAVCKLCRPPDLGAWLAEESEREVAAKQSSTGQAT